MSDYMPTTEQVRARYNADEFGESAGLNDPCPEFDRWLEAHDREVAVRATNRLYELLAKKGEYLDIFGLMYVADLVNRETKGEVQVVIEGCQLIEVHPEDGENK